MKLLGITEAKLLKVHIKEDQKHDTFRTAVTRGCFFSTQTAAPFGVWVSKRRYRRRQCGSGQVNTHKTLEILGVVNDSSAQNNINPKRNH